LESSVQPAHEKIATVGNVELTCFLWIDRHSRNLLESRAVHAVIVFQAGAGDDGRRAVRSNLHNSIPIELGEIEKAVVRNCQSQRCADIDGGVSRKYDRQGCHLPLGTDLSQATVAGIRNDHCSIAGDHNSARRIEPGVHRIPVDVARSSGASDRAHLPFRRDLPNAIVVSVGHVDIAMRVYCNSDWSIEASYGCRTVQVTGNTVAGYGRDQPSGGDFPNAIVAGIGDK
jgi:hypothetical protein